MPREDPDHVDSTITQTACVEARKLMSHAGPAERLQATADDGDLGLGFRSEYAEVNGVKLHYLEGEVIDQCGHYVPEECPGRFLELVKAFLASSSEEHHAS
jgi:pimeloyl-ACP methyl ester carboxylesterase